ncbi:hypothetical protein [Aquimarina brevivitae]|uniref:Uncharacterized protein n=1 Tax=Aquimarina brevivitae TaxID=323412 RepID=A0A4Q7PJ99_9FLAO|nr:hypothetical protein [Aquimarina brevivitae]RZS98992.1 hypothetical protein EV197_0194 [Aquimarina brevivitae]
MKYVIRILFIGILIMIATGYYYKNTNDHLTGDRWVGIGILVAAFVLMPLFIIHRWKGKRVEDYMLTKDNLKKMMDYDKEEKEKKE